MNQAINYIVRKYKNNKDNYLYCKKDQNNKD